MDAALSIGCAVAQIAKSLVFSGGGVRPSDSGGRLGANRVDLAKIEKATGMKLAGPTPDT